MGFAMPQSRADVCVASSLFLVLAAGGCERAAERDTGGARLGITLATQDTPYSGLVAVADTQGFFEEAGVDVEVTLHPSGLDALHAVMRGEAHVATVADVAFAGAMDEDPSLRVIAAIGASSGSEVVARRDRGIQEPADLKGKRVGYSPGTSSRYFLNSFLLTQHVSPRDVTAVPVPPARQVEAVVSGEVDAVSAFDVYAFDARKQLGENAVAWDVQNTLDYQWLLVARPDATQSPEAKKRLLKALILAEQFAVNHVEETKSILAEHWSIDPEFIRYSWSRTRLFVSLNQSVVTALQGYAEWHMENEGSTGSPPDVLRYIDRRPMEELDPNLITVFR
jgi:ABC-type nitrate/sulfonate/bicarbonate transport system substrate-binding protein